jgi:predicted permease
MQLLLPTVIPLIAGYAVARWVGLSTKPVETILRWVLFPALLFTVLRDRMPFQTFLLVSMTGAVMVVAGLALVRSAHRFLKPNVDRAAGTLNVACFSVPFFALSWASNGLGTACALFVGVAITMFVIEKRSDWKAIFREPWVYAVAAALLLQEGRFATGSLDTWLKPLAMASYPVLLLFLGAALQPKLSLRDASAWATVGVRMVSGLGVGLLAVTLLPFSSAIAQGVIITSLAPPATQAMTLSGEGNESASARAAATLGTLVSLIAITLILLTGWTPWRS